MVHCIHLGVTGYYFQKYYISFYDDQSPPYAVCHGIRLGVSSLSLQSVKLPNIHSVPSYVETANFTLRNFYTM